ncbi:MAG: hypothetical protein RIC89_21635 [Pseudomonadales bacterium]
MVRNVQWSSLPEAARQAGVSESEIKSLAYRGELTTAIYSPKKRYLVFTRADGGGRIGHATCEYFGALAVPKAITDKLVGGESTNLNGLGTRPLDLRGLSNWQGICPFSSEESGNLVGWQALHEPKPFKGSLLMTPMPEETLGRAGIRKINEARPSDFQGNELTAAWDKAMDRLYPNDYSLNYRANGEVGPDALIFFALDEAGGAESGEGKGDAKQDESELSPPGDRADDMAWLLWRIRQDHPRMSAKAIRSLLSREIETAEPKYDIDCILRDVRGNDIYWCNLKGEEKKLSWRAFENRLSRLKTSDQSEGDA